MTNMLIVASTSGVSRPLSIMNFECKCNHYQDRGCLCVDVSFFEKSLMKS